MLANFFRNAIKPNLFRSINHERSLRCFSAVNFSNSKNSEPNGPEDPTTARGNAEGTQQQPQQQNQVELDKLKAENIKLIETIKDLDDKYKRALAEAENTRIRSKKQLEDAKIYAIQAFCKDLLEVADIFKSAIDSVPKESLQSNNELKSLYDGVVMTEQKLLNVFLRHGLVPVNPLGAKFDPNEHHALFQVEDQGKEPGTVANVTKIGFKLHDRTIRPAMVGVVKSP